MGLGKIQTVRSMMFCLEKSLLEALASLHALLVCSQADTFEQEFQDFLVPLKKDAGSVSNGMKSLLFQVVHIACEGEVDNRELDILRTRVHSLKFTVQRFSKKFIEAKERLPISGVSESLANFHLFGYSLCSTARIVSNLSHELVNIKEEREVRESRSKQPSEKGFTFFDTFDSHVIFDPEHLNFVLRNSLSILTAFYLGLFGVGNIVPTSNAGMASTCALMLSKFLGTGLTNNLNRLQGLVLGTVMGQMLYSLFGGCGHAYIVLMAFTLWIWLSATMFIYFHSATHGNMALFLAAWGSQNMLQGCTNKYFEPAATYSKIVNCVLSIMIIVTYDLIFSKGRCSDKAHQVYTDTYRVMDKVLVQTLSANTSNTYPLSGQILANLSKARQLGREANEEPRYWRVPWRFDSFEATLDAAAGLRAVIANLIYSASLDALPGNPKRKTFKRCIDMPEFRPILEAIIAKMEVMKQLSGVFVHEVSDPFPGFKGSANHDFVSQQRFNIRMFSEAFSKKPALPARFISSLEHDPASLVGVICCTVMSIMESMRSSHHVLLQERS